jgi:hypothetical protein
MGCVWKGEIRPQHVVVVRCEGQAIPELIGRFLKRPEVVYAELNGLMNLLEGGELKMKQQRGAILLLTLLGLATVSVLAGAFVEMGFYEQRHSERSQDGTRAFYLSESALDQGLGWLRKQLQEQGVTPDWTDRRVLFGGEWQKLAQGVYLTTLDPDDNNPNSEIKRFTIDGWGVSGTVAAPLAARRNTMVVQTKSFASYAYFTNSETTPTGQSVWFVTGDVMEGPTHTNGQFSMYGTPKFLGPVSSVNRIINKWGGDQFTKPYFKEPPKLGVPPKEFPTKSLTKIIEKAQEGGAVFQGDTSVTLLSDGTMRVTNAQQGLNDQVMPLPGKDVLYVDGGNLTLKGTLKGRLTLGASGDVKVVDSVTYANDPRRDPASKDMLGIVAGANVVIPQEAPHDLRIDASIIAIKTSFGVENWWEGAPKGTLTINGGLIQANRGPVGQFNAANGQKLSGYTKDYHYDQRLKSTAPPAFPLEDYTVLVWQEVKS